MCSTCGCGHDDHVTVLKPGELRAMESNGISLDPNGHSHHHEHGSHTHNHEKTIIEVEQDILNNNQMLAQRNRGYFEAKNIFALNLVSSPGSGKTTLI